MDKIFDIDPSEIKLEKKPWDHDDLRNLWARENMMFQYAKDYYSHLIERGERLFDYYEGNIFTDEELSVMEDVEDKIVLQPKIMKGPIRALVGQTMKGRRSGQISVEGGSFDEPVSDQTMKEIEVWNAVLKSMEQASEEKYIVRDAIHDCHVSGYPNVIIWEKLHPYEDRVCGILKPRKLAWHSCLFAPYKFSHVAGKDIKELLYWDLYAKADLLNMFKGSKDRINAHFSQLDTKDSSLLSSINQWEGNVSSETREKLMNIVEMGLELYNSPTGLIPVIQHLYPIMREEEIWINKEDESEMDYKVRPGTWDDERWDLWKKQNEEWYEGPYERNVITLWATAWTSTGLVLDNNKHWFQNKGRLPASFWIGCMISGKPSGLGVDLEDNTKANAVAETENLDDLRKGNQKLIIMQDGSIINTEDVPSEAAKSVGVLVTEKGTPANEAIQIIQRQAGQAYKNFGDQRKQSMSDETRVNEAMMGDSAPRQSAIAKQLEVAQTLVVLAIYIDNFNLQWECHQNLKLALVPHAYQDEEVLEIIDDVTRKTERVTINQPAEWDADGNVTRVINDLSSPRCRWKIMPVDDSPTAKEQEMQSALVFINAASGPLITADKSGKFFSRVLMAMPNRFLNDAGKALAKDVEMSSQQQAEIDKQQTLHEAQIELMKAQAEMIKAEKTGKSISFTGEQLVKYPALMQVITAMGLGPKEPMPAQAQQDVSQQPIDMMAAK